jgi:hypothetical protein
VLALCLAAVSEQRASAWGRFNISGGFNISYEGGGHCLLWGLWRSSPYPGCDVPGMCDFNNDPALSYAPGWPSAPYYGPNSPGYPFYGHGPDVNTQPQVPVEARAKPAETQPATQNTSGYQPAAYSYSSSGYYGYQGYYGSQPVGYYPAANYYGYYSAPAYWYGR